MSDDNILLSSISTEAPSEFFKSVSMGDYPSIKFNKYFNPYFQTESLKTHRILPGFEQLTHVYKLALAKKLDKDSINEIMHFAFDLAHEKRTLAHLIFLLNQDPDAVFDSILLEDTAQASENLKLKFHSYLKKNLNPNVIAKLLFTDIGKINVDIIHDLLEFKTNSHITYVLKTLQKSPNLREILESIELTEKSNIEFIRICLDLPVNHPITSIHCKQAALKALLSNLRQLHDGPCFATSLAIEILSSRPDLAAKDLKQLIEKDELIKSGIPIPHLKKIEEDGIDPLLKIWENSLATMSEMGENGMIKKNILRSVMYAIQMKLTKLKISPSASIKKTLLHLHNTLLSDVVLLYDQGAFVFYYKNTRIDSAEKFQNFIKSRFSNENGPLYDILMPYFGSKEFIQHTLTKFHPTRNPKYTPWMSCCGNDTKKVLDTYFETHLSVQKISQKRAEDRLKQIILLGQRLSFADKQEYLKNPRKLDSFRIVDHHACSLMLGHPSLMAAWTQQRPISEWIEKQVLTPGKRISDRLIDEETILRFQKKMEEEVLPKFIPKSRIAHYSKFFFRVPSSLSVQEYRQRVYDHFQRIFAVHGPLVEKMARKIDTALYESLDEKIKKELEKSAVHFADSNFARGEKDIHFCFVVNPGTGKLEMWESDVDGKNLKSIRQDYWIQNQDWEVTLL